MRYFKILSCLCVFLISGQASAQSSKKGAADLIAESKKNAEFSMNSVTPQEKIKYSKAGIDIAAKCIAEFPREAGCYFYRAVNIGLHTETAGAGFQKKLKQMIKDCEKVISLDEKYDGGGAYRILGNIYLKTPSFSLSKNSVMKDVDKAYDYAQQALTIAGDEAENKLLMGEVLYEKENWHEAGDYLREAVKGLPHKQPLTWYDKKTLKNAQNLLRKTEKKLTKKG